jgi:trimeric autotransporter adhesin
MTFASALSESNGFDIKSATLRGLGVSRKLGINYELPTWCELFIYIGAMNKFSQIAYLTAVWLLALTASAVAEEINSRKLPSVSPQFGIQYTTQGAGFESLGSLDALVPVFQTPGNNATFIQGRLFVDNDSQIAGSVLLGHRTYDQKNDHIVGTYIGYDARETGESYFKQLGLGFESLGQWDFRANAYLPLGDVRQQVGSTMNTGAVFSGNNVFAQQKRLLELGLHGFDAEVGTKLARLGSGDLRGYAGAYYFSAGDKEALGWKARLEAKPTNFLAVNLSLQNDALFDTRAILSVGVNFPGSGARKGIKQTGNLARMGNFVDRRTTIAVVEGVESSVSSTPLTNPATGQPWNIVHVTSVGNSNGTFESPYGFDKFSQALADASAKPGSLVYVRADNNTNTLPGFTLPGGISIASSLGLKEINTREIGSVKLPSGGSDISPIIAGDVTLTSNASFNGFTVNGSVLGENISDVNITNNTIQNGEGINLSNATGKVNIANNTIRDNQSNGIAISNDSGSAEIAIADNKITNNLNGAVIDLMGSATASAQITNNMITGVGFGVDVKLVDDSQLTNLGISNNQITGSLEDLSQGIQVSGNDNAKITADITGNTISNTSLAGIGVELKQNSQGKVNIANNNISNIEGNELSDGIDVKLLDFATTTGISISNNTIANTTGRGVSVGNFADNTETNVVISKNNIDTTDAEGVGVQLVNGTTTVIDNLINNAFGEGIFLEGLTGSENVSGNTVTNTRITE